MTSPNMKPKRIWATADDGEEGSTYSIGVPDGIYCAAEDGPNPTLLCGYGNYGYTVDPSFSTCTSKPVGPRLCIRNSTHPRFAVYGPDRGTRMARWTTRSIPSQTFIACGDALVGQGYAERLRTLMAMGGSAGGLLMGAVVNKRPDLFRGVIAAVPFIVDVVTTMLDESIPLTTGEFDEWGTSKEQRQLRLHANNAAHTIR